MEIVGPVLEVTGTVVVQTGPRLTRAEWEATLPFAEPVAELSSQYSPRGIAVTTPVVPVVTYVRRDWVGAQATRFYQLDIHPVFVTGTVSTVAGVTVVGQWKRPEAQK